MPLVVAYHRPDDLTDALELLAAPGRIALAGGTVVNADRAPSTFEVVDLQALGLGAIEASSDGLRLGAMATLDDVARTTDTPPLVADAARAELPSTLRTLATIGGTVAVAGAESVLLAALLAHDAQVELSSGQVQPLEAVLGAGIGVGTLITAVRIDPTGTGARASTARTPADTPIVAALGRRVGDSIRLALTGVDAHPRLVDPTDPLADLSPPGDFRGSAEYRLELARVLSRRVLGELQ